MLKQNKNKLTEYELYLSWVNDFLTLNCFCEYYGLTKQEAENLLKKYKSEYQQLIDSVDIESKDFQEFILEASGNWKKWKDFGLSTQDKYVNTDNLFIWEYGHRDSGLLVKSNLEQIAQIINEFNQSLKARSEKPFIWMSTLDCFAYGYRHCILCITHNEQGKITPEFKLLYALIKRLENYPVLNEDHYSELEFLAACENIDQEFKYFIRSYDPDEWIKPFNDWELSILESKEFDSSILYQYFDNPENGTDDTGFYPDEDELFEAIEKCFQDRTKYKTKQEIELLHLYYGSILIPKDVQVKLSENGKYYQVVNSWDNMTEKEIEWFKDWNQLEEIYILRYFDFE